MRHLQRRTFLASASAAALVGRAALAQSPAAADALSVRPPQKPAPSSSALVAKADLGGVVAYAAIDLASGQVIEAERADLPLPPASILKSVTALYALDRLGPQHRFRTRVIRSGDMLVLAGGGDPVLTTDDLARLADAVVASGQASPARFAIWGGALPRIAELVPEQAVYLSYNPAISGMILNFNRVHLEWRPDAADYQLSLEARADANSPRAYTITARPGTQTELFTYSADARREHWVVSRAAMGRRAGSRWLPVRLPELYAGDVFQTLCRARGLVLPAAEIIDDLPEGNDIAGIDSPPLREILIGMMRYSTNLTAEVVGLHASGATTLVGSGAAMRMWLRDKGVEGAFVFADHSGLSADSRVTAGGMARLMAGYGQTSGLQEMMKDDPLVDDLGRSPASPARIEAKTGTLNFVSNLSGYATGRDGRGIGFAVLCADQSRREMSEGQEQPASARNWTRQAKLLQRQLIEGWVQTAPQVPVTAADDGPEPIVQ